MSVGKGRTIISNSNEDYLMKGRMQNESNRLDQSDDRVEPEDMTGLQTSMGIIETGFTAFTRPKDGLLEFILSPANLNAAYKKVKCNKGSGGRRYRCRRRYSTSACHR